MLTITVPAKEWWDEEHETFMTSRSATLQLEHSLVSLSKWESKWKKPFLSKGDKTYEELIDYFRCMTINRNVDSYVYGALTPENIEEISNYINDTKSATTIRYLNRNTGAPTIITSEVIYSWMVMWNIPFECQKWHLSRLLMLIEVIEIQNSPKKKMGRNEIMRSNAELNRARRTKLHSKG